MFLELLRRRSQRPPVFVAFDLLWVDREDLRALPLIERKRRLKRLLPRSRGSRILYANHTEKRSVELYRAICERDCEGWSQSTKRARIVSRLAG